MIQINMEHCDKYPLFQFKHNRNCQYNRIMVIKMTFWRFIFSHCLIIISALSLKLGTYLPHVGYCKENMFNCNERMLHLWKPCKTITFSKLLLYCVSSDSMSNITNHNLHSFELHLKSNIYIAWITKLDN